jgi:hypothetical protein
LLHILLLGNRKLETASPVYMRTIPEKTLNGGDDDDDDDDDDGSH